MNSIEQMVNTISNTLTGTGLLWNSVSREDYEKFEYYYIFDALKGDRFGQAFCKKFGISTASPLYYFEDMNTCKNWIEKNYIKHET